MDGADAVDPRADRDRHWALGDVSARAVQRRAGALLLLSAACAITAAAGWHSPVRIGLALVFLLLVPGYAVAELFELTDPLYMLIVAVGVSIALDTGVSMTLLYARAWSLGLTTGILLGVTTTALAAAVARVRRRERRTAGAARPA